VSQNGGLVVVAFGDSITAAGEVPEEMRWPHVVEVRLQESLPDRNVTVINAGVGGHTSREGLARIEADVLRHHADIVLVQFGGNDATKEPNRHVSLAEYETNLETIRSKTGSGGRSRMAVLTFPPVINDWHAWGHDEAYSDYGGVDGFIEQYRHVTREFARARALPLADIDRALRDAMQRDGVGRYIRPDGVHLTADGNGVVSGSVLQILRAMI
jgi:lysophospholipase L1-like esterase